MQCQKIDMLEAAAVQRRRVNIKYQNTYGKITDCKDVIVLDVFAENGIEVITVKDDAKVCFLNSSNIQAVSANDQLRPLIQYP